MAEAQTVKTVIAFFTGITISGLLFLGIQAALPIMAQTENTTTTDNFSLVELLPDIEKIYREALTTPLHEAKKKIYDDDIAQFYQLLLEKSDLDIPTDNSN